MYLGYDVIGEDRNCIDHVKIGNITTWWPSSIVIRQNKTFKKRRRKHDVLSTSLLSDAIPNGRAQLGGK
jgi:hypothetical protein